MIKQFFYYGPSNEMAHADVETVSVERMKKRYRSMR